MRALGILRPAHTGSTAGNAVNTESTAGTAAEEPFARVMTRALLPSREGLTMGLWPVPARPNCASSGASDVAPLPVIRRPGESEGETSAKQISRFVPLIGLPGKDSAGPATLLPLGSEAAGLAEEPTQTSGNRNASREVPPAGHSRKSSSDATAKSAKTSGGKSRGQCASVSAQAKAVSLDDDEASGPSPANPPAATISGKDRGRHEEDATVGTAVRNETRTTAEIPAGIIMPLAVGITPVVSPLTPPPAARKNPADNDSSATAPPPGASASASAPAVAVSTDNGTESVPLSNPAPIAKVSGKDRDRHAADATAGIAVPNESRSTADKSAAITLPKVAGTPPAAPPLTPLPSARKNPANNDATATVSPTSASPSKSTKAASLSVDDGDEPDSSPANASAGGMALSQETPAAANETAEIMAPKMVGIPLAAPLLTPLAVEKKNQVDNNSPAADLPSFVAAGKMGVGISGSPVNHAGGRKSVSSPETTPTTGPAADRTREDLRGGAKLDDRQKNAADAAGSGKIAAGDSPADSAPVGVSEKKELSVAVPGPEMAPASVAHLAKASAATDPTNETMASAPVENHGTAAANQSLPMNKTDKANKIAGSNGKAEKVLPGGAELLAAGNNLPPAGSPARLSPRAEADLMVGAAPRAESAPSPAASAAGTPNSSIVDMQSRALERTQDIVAVHAVRMVNTNLDSVQVVIKPGAGLQLSLEMRQRGDAIDAQVAVQQGNGAHLQQHWPELQQRLEQRGIRLAPLEGGNNFASSQDSSGYQPPPREFTHADPVAASAFAAFALAGHALQSSAPSAAAINYYNGWESWA